MNEKYNYEMVAWQAQCELELIAEEWPQESKVAPQVLKQRNLRITQFAH
jgi:hypothetical protein